jgi:hypothetical protein
MKWIDLIKHCIRHVKQFWVLHLMKYKHNQFVNLHYEISALWLIIYLLVILIKSSGSRNIVSYVGGWIGWFDLLTPYTFNSGLQAIATQFMIHQYTRTRVLSLH